MSNPPQVTVILLNYESADETIACLRSLAQQDGPAADVIVVDNRSKDDSVARLRAEFPAIRLLEMDENRGFSAGNNAAIRLALSEGADYLWVLNNDTTVAPDALGFMVSLAEANPKIGAVGCCIRDQNRRDRIQAWGGGKILTPLGVSFHMRRPVPNDELSYLTAASVLFRIKAIREVGLFDEGFFMYWEDADLSVRLRHAGWQLAVAPEAAVYHKKAASFRGDFSRRDAIVTRSQVRFFRKHSHCPLVGIVLGAALRSLKRLAAFQPRRALAVWVQVRRALREPWPTQPDHSPTSTRPIG